MEYLRKLFAACLIFSLALVQCAQAQGYESIFGDSITWKFYTEAVNFGGGITMQWVNENDTVVINNKTYKNLQSPSGLSSAHYLREDTSSGKIWVYNDSKEDENLVMDLMLEQEDSFYLNHYKRSYEQIDTGWHKVDTIFHKEGRKHVLFQKKGEEKSKDRLLFIEGVGPNIGFLTIYTAAEYQYLICGYKNQKRVYFDSLLKYSRIDTTLDSCPKIGRWYNGIDDNQKDSPNHVFTHPNPSSGHINFNIQNHIQAFPIILKIFNTNGAQVLSRQFRQPEFEISKPGKENIYFYKLFTSDHQLIATGKLLFVN